MASEKLMRDDLDDRRDLVVALPRLDGVGLTGGVETWSCSARPIVSSTPSVSDSVSSSSSSCRGLPLVMRKTPKKVKRHPPTNLTA